MDRYSLLTLAEQASKLLNLQKKTAKAIQTAKLASWVNLLCACFAGFSILLYLAYWPIVLILLFVSFSYMIMALMFDNRVIMLSNKSLNIAILLNQLNDKLGGVSDVRKPRRIPNRKP